MQIYFKHNKRWLALKRAVLVRMLYPARLSRLRSSYCKCRNSSAVDRSNSKISKYTSNGLIPSTIGSSSSIILIKYFQHLSLTSLSVISKLKQISPNLSPPTTSCGDLPLFKMKYSNSLQGVCGVLKLCIVSDILSKPIRVHRSSADKISRLSFLSFHALFIEKTAFDRSNGTMAFEGDI